MVKKILAGLTLPFLLIGCAPERIDTSGQACASNADCYCHGFDGAKPIMEIIHPGICSPDTHTCNKCVYADP